MPFRVQWSLAGIRVETEFEETRHVLLEVQEVLEALEGIVKRAVELKIKRFKESKLSSAEIAEVWRKATANCHVVALVRILQTALIPHFGRHRQFAVEHWRLFWVVHLRLFLAVH